MGFTTAVLGASGYAGGELVRLLDGHPSFQVEYLGAHTSAGSHLGAVHPHLPDGDRMLGPIAASEVDDCDVAFLALPHGASAALAVELAQSGCRVVDLGADFRLDSPQRWLDAYGTQHPAPGELGSWTYGVPELFAADLDGSTKTAVPGCYPTSVVLALAPVLAAGLIDPAGIVVDSISGVTGAGRSVNPELTYGAVAEGVSAYALGTHRHRPEMEQALGNFAPEEPTILFTPHLAPMQRGILSTCYATMIGDPTTTNLTAALAETYDSAPFVALSDGPPKTRWVVGSNNCILHAHADDRSGKAIIVSALDNLLKGAAGQAVQCANLMMGLDESAGLSQAGWLP